MTFIEIDGRSIPAEPFVRDLQNQIATLAVQKACAEAQIAYLAGIIQELSSAAEEGENVEQPFVFPPPDPSQTD